MTFNESLEKFRFLSSLYAADAPDAQLLAEYPSSNNARTLFKNNTKYIIHDPVPPPEDHLLKILGPHHLMCGWGCQIPVTSEICPPHFLTEHWNKFFEEECAPVWTPPGKDSVYITLFPHESLPATQQAINPDCLYKLHSKEALKEINCNQPQTFQEMSLPCIIKLSHGYAGTGNFFVHSVEEFLKTRSLINYRWPDARFIQTEIIQNVIGDYCAQFYLDKQGHLAWIGFTEQIFNENKRWSGGHFDLHLQETLYKELYHIALPVASFLHAEGYFGVVGFDVLKNDKNELFLIDLNPRLNGSTPFLIAARLLVSKGYTYGIYTPSLPFNGSFKEFLDKTDKITQAKVLVLSAYESKANNTSIFHVSIHAQSKENCLSTLHFVKNATTSD